MTSELIWREIELTKKSKPIVVSMGNLAASGGYYISCGANAIFAEPTTITGSIGVFGMLPNFSQLANKMGINAEQVNTHKNASGYSPFEPITDEYKSIALEGVERTYKTFVNRVATGSKNECDIELVKKDSKGKVLWRRIIGGTSYDKAGQVVRTKDGSYIVVGSTSSFGKGNYDVFIVKVSSKGEILWQKTYGEFLGRA